MPEGSRRVRGLSSIAERWRGERDVRAARLALLRMLPEISLPLFLGVGATIIGNALVFLATLFATGALVSAVQQAAGTGLDSPQTGHVIVILVLKTGLYLAAQLFEELRGVLLESLGRRTDGALRQRLMRAVLAPEGVAHLEDAEVLDRIRDAQGIGTLRGITAWDAVRGMAQNADRRLTTIAAAAFLFGFRWWLPVGLLAFGMLVRYRLVGDRLRAAVSRTRKVESLRRADYFRDLAMTPTAAKESRVFGLADWILGRFSSWWREGMQALWLERKEQTTSSWVVGVSWGAIVFGGLFLVGRAAATGEISIARLAVLAPAIMTAGVIWIGQQDIWVSHGTATVHPILELERQGGGRILSGQRDPSALPRERIELDGVRFRYPGRSADVFADLTLSVPAGRSLAIVGPNGAGKTTLVKLLARLYDPGGGAIHIDGVDLRDLDLDGWRRRIAVIFQDFVRFEMSAGDNIGLGAIEHNHDLERVRAAAAKAGAESIIERLPSGWDTVLSREYSGGADLSGGQWQRVALARALFAVESGAGLLVLDEPTAQLDVRAEAQLFDRFLELTAGTTSILISHRFSSVRHADRICVLDQGRIVEQGTHDALLAADGRYAHMFHLQAARFADGTPLDEVADA